MLKLIKQSSVPKSWLSMRLCGTHAYPSAAGCSNHIYTHVNLYPLPARTLHTPSPQ